MVTKINTPFIDGNPVSSANPFPVAVVSGGAGGGASVTDPATVTGQTAIKTAIDTSNGALGTSVDAEATGNGTIIALLKRLRTLLSNTLTVGGSVSVTNFPSTQPISGSISITGVTPASNKMPVSTVLDATVSNNTVAVAGISTTVTNTPTITSGTAYSAGQTIGGVLTLTGVARYSAGSGLIQNVMASVISGQTPALDIVFFNAALTASTIANQTIPVIGTADLSKICGVASLTSSYMLGTSSLLASFNSALTYKLTTGTAAYALIITRTPVTFSSTTDLTLIVSGPVD